MAKIQVLVDGKRVSVMSGSTILDAVKKAGSEVPTLCHNPILEPSGHCRICLVEDLTSNKLLTACNTRAEEGMVINTQTERVHSARKKILRMLLLNHPEACVVCEKNNSCTLKELASNYGISLVSTGKVGNLHPIVDANPFIHRDLTKCIGCQMCVRVCREVQGACAIGFSGFGTSARPATLGDMASSDCELCGLCVSICPVGALIEKPSKHHGTPERKSKVVCPYCGVGCQMFVMVKSGRIIGVEAGVPGSVNARSLCVKGRYGFGFVSHPERLKKPLIKEDGEFREATWEEAIDRVVSGLRQAKRLGPQAIGVLSSAKATNEENYLIQKFARVVLGTNNIDHCARLCHAPSVTGLAQSFGSGAMTNSYDDIKRARVILITGTNTSENHPVIAQMIKTAVLSGKTKLIVVDPRDIKLARFAEIFLQPRPGTDVAWLNGFARVIITEGLMDEKFIRERTESFDEFSRSVMPYTPEVVQKICGIPPQELKRAARLYAKSGASAIFYAMGITQHTSGTDNVKAIANLAMLTGNIGRPGTGVNPLRGQNNVQGACDMGALPVSLPGYKRVDEKEARVKFEKAWGATIPEEPGLTVVEMMKAAESGKIRAMYIVGENPVVTDPDSEHVKSALKKLDFLVVQDIFLTETAELADVVLPGAAAFEKTGTYTNTERRVQLSMKAVDPPGEAKSDMDIISELAGALNGDMKYESPSEVMEEISLLVPSYGGISYSRLEKSGIQWPCPNTGHPGTKILHEKEFTRGKGKFHAVEFADPAELPDKRYPFVLTTGRILFHYHSGSMSRRSVLAKHISGGWVEINPQDARRIGIKDGSKVKVVSRRGKVSTKARISSRSPRGVVFMSFHFAEEAVNALVNPALDKESKIPEFKVCAVRIEPEVQIE